MNKYVNRIQNIYCDKCEDEECLECNAIGIAKSIESEIRADERAKVLTRFLFELGKNVAYEKEKVFGTDVIKVDALMTICREVAEQLEEQSNEVNRN